MISHLVQSLSLMCSNCTVQFPLMLIVQFSASLMSHRPLVNFWLTESTTFKVYSPKNVFTWQDDNKYVTFFHPLNPSTLTIVSWHPLFLNVYNTDSNNIYKIKHCCGVYSVLHLGFSTIYWWLMMFHVLLPHWIHITLWCRYSY